ncbi:endoplasmic reticulum export factor secretory 16 isoform X2 [Musca autumnalis]|uniref:endoplasmic reticulum export factor secretory 16 isoform X2 n=3 Tax=Musca autumnalis TaxID=221902 RepID=UPI003CF64E7B
MSWVHHQQQHPHQTNHPPNHQKSSSTSIQQSFNINANSSSSSLVNANNPSSSVMQSKQVVPPSLRPGSLAQQPIATTSSQQLQSQLRNQSLSSTAHNSSLLMTSQYPQKPPNLLPNMGTRMRLNNATGPPPYASATPQQQQHVHATSQALGHHNNNNNNPMPLNQGAYQNQQNTWQNHHTASTQNYLPATKMMPQQQTQPPMPPAANVAAAGGMGGNAGNTKNWQQNYQNSNVLYQQQQQQQQQQTSAVQQQWTQQQQNPATAAATYDNLFNHTPATPQQVSNNAYQQQQQATPVAATYFQQAPTSVAAAAPPHQQQHQQPQANAVNFFDNTNNNNQSTGGDGWGDWDWNDNSTIDANSSINANEQSQQKQQHQQQHQATSVAQQQPPPAPPASLANDLQHHHNQAINSNIIADSFNQPQNNDSWNWNAGTNENEQHVANTTTTTNESKLVEQQQHNDNWNWNSGDMESQQQQQPAPLITNDHSSNDNWNWQTNENQQQLTSATITTQQQQPTSLEKPGISVIQKTENQAPVVQMATSTAVNALTENHNYNNAAAPPPPPPSTSSGPTNNIPNTVFVSQAKPVTLPSRQYASPPMGNTPVTENTPETALMPPPQAFQNQVEEPAGGNRPANVQTPNVPPTTTPVPSNLPPSAGLPPPAASGMAGNPFKRTGLAQHHRATGLMPTTAPVAAPVPPTVTPAAFNMPAPPPPADFANPAAAAGPITLMEPENNELPLQENQEILTPPVSIVATPQQQSSISLPHAGPASTPLQQPPPNDERNQYLQTSHLSENSEDQQPEADSGLLPPPGLSRLVLGEPELEASQRMVMGTEATTTTGGNTSTVSDVMHLEERHADGEDTASENAVPVVSSNQAPPTTSSTDRNLYMVPGESNANHSQQPQQQQHQRVVTGVELQEQREIEMDGENLEDQQQQQQQQQQLQHQQHHQVHQNLSPEARNEPPVEGADDNVELNMPTITTNQPLEPSEATHGSSSKAKDNHNISSPNDEDDSDDRLLNDRAINHSTAGSSKSRSKYEIERQGSSRRRDKRSMQRYDSEEYLNSEDGEYSSDREERERRERNERRRNYREGSVRSERGDDDDKRSRRQPRDKRDKYYYDEERTRGGDRAKPDLRRQRQRGGGYENDSRYETEESTRFDSRKETSRRSMRHPDAERRDRRHGGGGDRSDQDEYQRSRGGYRSSKRSGDNYESDRRERRRDDYDSTTLERRRRSDKHRDPRYRDDPRYDPREYEEYRKHSSRNARESDLEKEGPGSRRMLHDPRHAAAAMYGGYPSAGGYYDPYTAYYYQQMARTNPQAYAEWYKKYYGQHAAAGATGAPGVAGVMPTMPGMTASGEASLTAQGNDGRESVHSGRSSAHNDMKDRSGVRDPDPIATEPQRLTPCKFINEHAVVSFGSGILVTVKPKYTPHGHISNIVKLLKFKPNDETRKLFKVFPGPLVRGLTHKKTVIEFCQEQIRLGPMETTIYAKQLISNNAEKYRASYTLMWNLLILLLKQNGMVVGTDIAELLLKNQQQFAYQTPNSTLNNSLKSKSGSNSPVAAVTAAEEEASKETNEEIEKPETIPLHEQEEKTNADSAEDEPKESKAPNSCPLTESEITEKFRNYLLYGNVNEALDWATDNNLWGHALFLASKLDRRSHANVMMKFANKLALNDPLQTLYQLMSGRTPSSVTCVQDEKWGDWRPHLSMILSNTSQKPELDRKAITTLGDSLFNRGDLYAAHFCYLMAQVNFGRYQESATQETSLQQHLPKLVLLGSSHYKQFQDFAHNEAIIMTEIYEYACSLNDEKFSIVEFQPYKFLLATRLLDYGFHLKSLMYLEQIAVHITRDPSKYEGSFINKVYELADRLKYYDPVLEKTIDDQQQQGQDEDGAGDGNLNSSQQQLEEQKWLQSLRQMAQQYKTDYGFAAATATGASLIDGQQPQQSQQVMDPSYNYQQQQIDQQFMEINKQFSELNLQYQNNQTDQQTQQQPTFYNPEVMQQPQTAQQVPLMATDALQQPASLVDPYQQQHDQPLNQDLQQQQQSLDPNNPQDVYQQQQQQQQQSSYMQPDFQQHQGYTQAYYDPSQHQQQQQHYNNNDPSLDNQTNTADNVSYDYWSQQQQQMQGGYGSEEPNDIKHETYENPEIALTKSKTLPKTKTASSSPNAAAAKRATTTTPPSSSLYLNNNNNRKSSTLLKTKTNNVSSSLQHHKNKFDKNATTTTSVRTSLATKNQAKKTSLDTTTTNNHHQAFNKLDYETTSSANSIKDPFNTTTTTSIQSSSNPTTTTMPFSINNNARPTISMPKSKTYDTDDETNNAAGDKQQKGQQKSGSSNDSKQQQQQQAAAQKNNKENKDAKNANNSNQNSGWFGGIWNKFSLKPKNQMILPDDKNPSIVWDPEKKRWVNTDADEQAEEAFKPPPKMGDLMPQATQQQQQASSGAAAPPPQQQQQPLLQQQQQQQIPFMDPQQQYVPTSTPLSSSTPMSQQPQQPTTPNVAANNQNNPAPAKTPTLQSNMFKMQRNRTLKNAYVDVFNPSGAPVNKAAENILAPALPPATVPQSGFFIPGSTTGPTTGGVAGGQDNNNGGYQQQAQDTPQFYNPNQYGAGTGY